MGMSAWRNGQQGQDAVDDYLESSPLYSLEHQPSHGCETARAHRSPMTIFPNSRLRRDRIRSAACGIHCAVVPVGSPGSKSFVSRALHACNICVPALLCP